MKKIVEILLFTVFSYTALAADAPRSAKATFVETQITFKSGDLTMYGTLAMPNPKPTVNVAGVLLIPGSGPTDRDGNQPKLQTDLLKQIAQHLAVQGVASLRFDKRATKTYQMAWPTDPRKLNDFFSWDSFTSDARAAFATLQSSPGVDGKRCSILGHSEGGTFAVGIANQVGALSLILMATPGRPMSEVLNDQINRLLDTQHATPEQKKYFMSELARVIVVVEKTGEVPGDVPAGLKALFPASAGKLLQTELSYTPAEKVKAYKGPVIVMNGLQDIQVSPLLDAEPLYKGALSRRNAVSKIMLFQNLSHNFKKVSSTADPGFTGPVPDEVLNAISGWVKSSSK